MGVYDFFSSDSFSVFLSSFAPGVIFAVLYDIFRIKRALVPAGKIILFFDDIFYLLSCCVIYILYCLEVNFGIIRWYMPVTCFLAFIIYKMTIGDGVVKLVEKISAEIRHFFKTLALLIMKPVIKFVIKTYKFIIGYLCKVGNFLKKYKKHFSFYIYWCKIKNDSRRGFGFESYVNKNKHTRKF